MVCVVIEVNYASILPSILSFTFFEHTTYVALEMNFCCSSRHGVNYALRRHANCNKMSSYKLLLILEKTLIYE